MTNQLFEKEGKSIHCFKKGDIIIKLKNREIPKSVFNENLGIKIELQTKQIDTSFRSNPIEFICIENNLIYYREMKRDFHTKIRKVRWCLVDDYSEDWGLFVVPEGLTLEECFSEY